MRFTGDFSLRPYKEMKEAFADVPEAIENTVKIADRCKLTYFWANIITVRFFQLPTGKLLRNICACFVRKVLRKGMAKNLLKPQKTGWSLSYNW